MKPVTSRELLEFVQARCLEPQRDEDGDLVVIASPIPDGALQVLFHEIGELASVEHQVALRREAAGQQTFPLSEAN